MNVWWINHVALPPTEAGGTRHYSFARELIRRGHDVTIIASSFHYVRRQEMRMSVDRNFEMEVIRGVPFLWIRTPEYQESQVRRVWSWLTFAARLWGETGVDLLPTPDVVIGSSPYPFAALAAERLARRHEVPFVFEVRDLWPETLVQLGRWSRFHPFIVGLALIERYLYRSAERIVTVLPRADEYIVARGGSAEKILWIPNAVDFDMMPEISEPAGDDPLSIMYAGSHGLSNSLDRLIDVASRLEEDGWSGRVEFHLVGDGPAKPDLVDRVEREGLSNVRFSDAVSKSAIYGTLSTADAFVLLLEDSSLYEWGASPQKLFDYMAVGRPVLLGTSSSWDPVQEAGAGLTIDPSEPGRLADGVKRLCETSVAERRAMGRRGREYVRKNYDLSRLAESVDTMLGKVAGGG